MLNWSEQKIARLPLWLSLLFAAFLCFQAWISSECRDHHYGDHKDQNQTIKNYCTSDAMVILDIISFAEGNQSEFNLLFTGVVAIFTGVLACVTWTLARQTKGLAYAANEQAALTYKSIELGNKEFLATHRARLMVQSVTLDFPGGSSLDAQIGFRIANAGEARVNVIRYTIFPYVQIADAAFTPQLTEPSPKYPTGLVVDPGEIVLVIANPPSIESDHQRWLYEGGRLFIVGEICYGDGSVQRLVGFCREYSRETGMWQRTDNEYEYNY